MRDDEFTPGGFLGDTRFEADTVLTGTVTVRVVGARTGRPRERARVVLGACGFV
jgi:hypothetical protein